MGSTAKHKGSGWETDSGGAVMSRFSKILFWEFSMKRIANFTTLAYTMRLSDGISVWYRLWLILLYNEAKANKKCEAHSLNKALCRAIELCCESTLIQFRKVLLLTVWRRAKSEKPKRKIIFLFRSFSQSWFVSRFYAGSRRFKFWSSCILVKAT